ncbi:MAG: PaaI family thioesterase [candidate division WOR-3 bacterium]
MRILPRYRACFVCGRNNPCGLMGTFRTDGQKVYYDFVPGEHHVGYKNRVHGGIISAALDEAMGWAVYVATGGKMFYTWEIRVRFLVPVGPGMKLTVEAEFGKAERAYYTSSGKLVDEGGTVFARAWGKYVAIPDSDASEVLSYLDTEIDNPGQ